MKLIVRVYDIHSSDRLYEFGRGVKGREAPKPKRVLVSISIFVFCWDCVNSGLFERASSGQGVTRSMHQSTRVVRSMLSVAMLYRSRADMGGGGWP